MCYHHFWLGQYQDRNACVLRAPLIQLKYTLKHWKSTFSYSPLVQWSSPLSHFQEKGIFSWPFLGFHIYFKIPIASLTLEKSALPWPATLAALLMTNSNRKLSALGAAGVPVAWWG